MSNDDEDRDHRENVAETAAWEREKHGDSGETGQAFEDPDESDEWDRETRA
jgi:hypothetical protein